ncbi:MAG: DUF5667 domain-containing protein [Anaerolineae bacterium]
MKEYCGKPSVDLPPVVQEALDALRPVPDIDSEAWEAGREAYLSEARRLAASREERRLTGWLAPILSFLKLDLDQVRPLAVAWRTALIIALALGGSVGTVGAARSSLPGSPFYSLKVRLETWEMERLQEPDEVTEKALSQAQQRVEEAERLASRGRDVPIDVAALYQARLDTALQASDSLSEPQRLQTQVHISETLRQQLETMVSVAGQVQDREGEVDQVDDEDGVRALIRAMQETQARLSDPEHEGRHDDEDKPGIGAGVGDGPQGPRDAPGGPERDGGDGACKPRGPSDDERTEDKGARPDLDDRPGPPGGDDEEKPGNRSEHAERGDDDSDSDDGDDETGPNPGERDDDEDEDDARGPRDGRDGSEDDDDHHGGEDCSDDDEADENRSDREPGDNED